MDWCRAVHASKTGPTQRLAFFAYCFKNDEILVVVEAALAITLASVRKKETWSDCEEALRLWRPVARLSDKDWGEE